jgi:hypothetical protein
MDIVITIIWLIVLGLCLGIAQQQIMKRKRQKSIKEKRIW